MALDTDKLISLRLRNGWSQAETARQAGIGQTYYSALEGQRRTNPSPRTLRLLADVFHVEPAELVA